MYRAKQFFGALTASSDAGDERSIAHVLTPPQHDLFRRMAPNDRRHSIDVYETLRQAGDDDPDLLVAALLHDVGKAAGCIRLWQRTLIVLLQRWAPAMLSWLARGSNPNEPPWWRQGFVINRLHPKVGARWAAEAGCSPTTVVLIRRHQERVETIHSSEDRLLAALQRADGVN